MSELDELNRFNTEELPRLVKLVGASRVRELTLDDGSIRFRIKRGEPDSGVAGDGDASFELLEFEDHGPPTATVNSQQVGIFVRGRKRGSTPLASEGDAIAPGAVVGVVESLQVGTDVESEIGGTVRRFLVEEGDAVAYGQPLVELELAEPA